MKCAVRRAPCHCRTQAVAFTFQSSAYLRCVGELRTLPTPGSGCTLKTGLGTHRYGVPATALPEFCHHSY